MLISLLIFSLSLSAFRPLAVQRQKPVAAVDHEQDFAVQHLRCSAIWLNYEHFMGRA